MSEISESISLKMGLKFAVSLNMGETYVEYYISLSKYKSDKNELQSI